MIASAWNNLELWVLPVLVGLGCTLYTWGLFKAFREKKQILKIVPTPLNERLWVCIPARNEAQRLPATVDSLLTETCPHLSVVVVDDNSEDETSQWVLKKAQKDPRLGLFRNAAESAGKPGAMAAWVASLKSSHADMPSEILFLDADMQVQPGFLGGLLKVMRDHDADALSGVPKLICKSFWEALLVPAIAALAAALYPPSGLDRKGFLNGQVILIRTAALQKAGGWSSVANEVLEDVALAQRLVDTGSQIRLVDFQQVCATRMYNNFSEIMNGFAKNFSALNQGAAKGLWMALFGLVISTAPWVFSIASLMGPQDALPALLALVWVCLMQTMTRQQMGLPVWPVIFVPITAVGVLLIAVKSAYHVLAHKPLRWRGREVVLSDRSMS